MNPNHQVPPAMRYDDVGPESVSPREDLLNPLEGPFKCLDTVVALYDFPGTHPSHLSLDLGDTLYVLSKSDSGWWDGILIGPDGEVCRGWFPENYVRSVHYVQPVLNKLHLNKEIDSLTAANTAANVLIPLFKNFIQKSLDPARDSLSNTRKNSVVSFALSDTSTEKRKLTLGDDQPASVPPTPQPHQLSLVSNASYSTGSFIMSAGLGSGSFVMSYNDNDYVEPISVEEAEALTAKLKTEELKNVYWIPRLVDLGDILYYCERLNIYCDVLPLTPLIPEADTNDPTLDMPSEAAMDQVFVSLSSFPQAPAMESRSLSLGKSYESPKRDLNASSMSQSSSASYHNFSQPFYSTPGLFYNQVADVTKWTELGDQFNYFLDITWKALRDSNKQLFSMHLSKLTKIVSMVMSAARLTQDDFVETKLERSVRHKIRRLSEAFSQMYINSLLHLSVMHYPESFSATEYLSIGINGLNKSTSTSAHVSQSSRGLDATVIPHASSDLDVSYILRVDDDVALVRTRMSSLIRLFIKLSKEKRVHIRDYDNSDASDDEGVDRYNVMPQVYPRFITNEFNGGNWCNPFFTGFHSFLNLSGDRLKNKYHLKLVVDNYASKCIEERSLEIRKYSLEVLDLLDSSQQARYYNDDLRYERNDQVLRVIYKYLHTASEMIDMLESLDFTIFCLAKKDLGIGDQSKESTKSSGGLIFEYPSVLNFFQLKHQLHDIFARVITESQSLSLEDPDSFLPMKEEDPFVYARNAMKDTLESAARVLSNILQNKVKKKALDRLSLDQDATLRNTLEECMLICDNVVSLVKVLVDERETVLNYATRVMHENFNVDLLVEERNNTSAGVKADDNGGQYFSGSKNDNTPWYLEGDEIFDLLLDMNGNIKGGTKEALVAHLTHHDVLDNVFNEAFLTSFATILSISELLDQLVFRFNIEAPEGLSYEEFMQWKKKKQNRVRLKVLSIMKILLEDHWSTSYNVKGVIHRWLAFLKQPEVQAYSMASSLVEILQKIQMGELAVKVVKPQIPDERPPAPLTKGFSLRKLRLMDVEYIELARQLTIREFNLYCQIPKHACIHKVWGKKSGLTDSIASITAFIRASNQLTNFVAYLILRKDEIRKRVLAIRYFVLVAEKCRQYNNFSSMTAIISALYSSPIHRLKKTWAHVSGETMSKLQNMNKLMNSSRNFNEYRDMLKFIGNEACVPFFGVFLSDLTFTYHGNSEYLLNRTRMINFAKRSRTVEIVLGIDRFKRVGYNFQVVPEIQTFIDVWFDKCPTIAQQYQLSLNIEARETKRKPTNSQIRHPLVMGSK